MILQSELVDRMRAQGVIRADAPAAPLSSVERPWFVALLQGVAGWLAGIFLLVFLGLAVRPDSSASFFAIGALLLVAAWLLYRADRNAVFLDQLALAISIAGQFALAASAVRDSFSGLSIAATALAVQLFVLAVMPNKTARMLAALFGSVAWLYTVRFLLRPGSGEAVLFGENADRYSPTLGPWTIPIGWLLTWVPLLALAAWLIVREPQWMATRWRSFARPVLIGVLLGQSLGNLVATSINPFLFAAQAPALPLTWWALFPLMNVALAMASAYGAFRLRNNGLLGFAVLGALLHLSQFYYLYGTTLLWKSVIMLALGALLLFAGVWLRRRDAGAPA